MNEPKNPELELAEAFVQDTNCSVFLTGKAGTGKTTFLQAIRAQTGKQLVVTAPTGVAAINASGVTLHSFFSLPFGPLVPGNDVQARQYRISREKRDIIRSLDLLVIDEISMVRADLLDGVDGILRRCRRSELPFGGVQLLMIGDLHQLPPVAKDAEWEILGGYYDSPYFFSSAALRRIKLVSIELQHIYRQSDGRFIELLNRVRNNQLDAATLQQLNTRVISDFSPPEADGYITLCTHNHRADAINQAKLAALPGKSSRFEALVEGHFPEQAFPNAADLELKTGAQVMFVRNDTSPEKRYFNGKIGKIAKTTDEQIAIVCPGEPGTIEVGKVTWENVEYGVDPQTAEISRKTVGTFKQFPLKPAWAITIHKSQGLTFDKAVIDAQTAFAPGQVYVALSRCRAFEGLVLRSPLGARAVTTDPAVLRFLAEAQRNVPAAGELAAARIQYQRQLLLQCFDFGRLRRQLGGLAALLRAHASVIELGTAPDASAIWRQTEEAICRVGEKFQRQLQTLFSDTVEPAADRVIQDRLARASAYFGEQFATILTPFLAGLDVETDNKEIRKRVRDAIKEFREEHAIKLAAVQSCGDGFSPSKYLRALAVAVINAEQPSRKESSAARTAAEAGHPDLLGLLRDWRTKKALAQGVQAFQVLHQKALVQIAIDLPDTMAALKRINGIGKRLAEKYGAELVTLVGDYRRARGIEKASLVLAAAPDPATKPGKPAARNEDTRRVSLKLHQEGLAIPQIAAARELTVGTIEGHLAFFVEKGELSVSGLVAEERRKDIEARIGGMPGASLKELKTALGDDYSYGEIRLVLAHLQNSLR